MGLLTNPVILMLLGPLVLTPVFAGKECVHDGFCCETGGKKTDICTKESSCNGQATNTKCKKGKGNTTELCNLIPNTLTNVSYQKDSGIQIMAVNTWHWFDTRSAIICPIGTCQITNTVAGPGHSGCRNFTYWAADSTAGSLNWDTDGCPVGTSTWQVECSYNWATLDYQTANTFTMTITSACSSVTTTKQKYGTGAFHYNAGDTGGTNVVTFTSDLTNFIKQSATNPCFLTNCAMKKINSGSTCNYSNIIGAADSWFSMTSNLVGSVTTLSFSIDTSVAKSNIYLCLECELDGVKVYSNKHNSKVTLDCSTPFTTKALTDPNRVYTASPATYQVSSTWLDLFANTQPICTLASCVLKNSGCSNSYGGSNLSLGVSPHALSMVQTVVAGWNEAAGLSCQIGTGSDAVTKCSSFTITQQPYDCTGTLTVATSPSNPTFAYDSVTASFSVEDGANFFTSSQPTNCPITGCFFKNSGCGSTWSSDKLTFGSSTPWGITAEKQELVGYTRTVCVTCTNDNYSKTFDTVNSADFVVTQQPIVCTGTLSAAAGAAASASRSYNSGTTTEMVIDTTSMFTDSTNCTIQACSLLQSDCATPVSGSQCSLAGTSPFGLTCAKNVKLGYTENLCIKCNNDQHGQTYQTITHSYTFTQTHICLTSMTAGGSLPSNPTKAYSSVTTTEVVLADSKVIFTEAAAADCPLMSCSMLESTCSTAYSGYATFGTASTYAITMTRNVVAGHTTAVCISCTNGMDIQTHVYTMTQTALDCSSTLSRKNPAAASQAYQTVPSTWTIGDMNTFFMNSKAADCPITSCSLKAVGCASSFVAAVAGSGLAIPSASSPFTITANSNVVAGWVENICISCTNIGMTKTDDKFQVTQLGDVCSTALTLKTPTNPRVLTYDSVTTTELIGSDTYFFTDSQAGLGTCTTSTCTLFDEGCVVAYSGGKHYIESATVCDVKSYKNIPAGYTEKVCVMYTNTIQTITKDSYQIDQNPDPCLTALNAITPSALTFAYASALTQALGDYDTFVTNGATAACDVNSCTLYQPGCSTPYTPGRVTMGALGAKFALTSPRNVNAGWTETICFSCQNAAGDKVDTDNYVITQQPSPCYTHLSIKATPLASMTFPYSNTGIKTLHTGWTDVFDSSGPASCDPTNCILLSNDCVTAYSGSGSISVLGFPWSMTALHNIRLGYTETVCIQCTNGHQTIIFNNWQVTQQIDPCAIYQSPSASTSIQFDYDISLTQQVGGWDKWVSSATSPPCSPLTCSIYGAGCITSYTTAYPLGQLTLAGADPWNITAPRNSVSGWTENICYVCSDGTTTVSVDNILVISTPVECFNNYPKQVYWLGKKEKSIYQLVQFQFKDFYRYGDIATQPCPIISSFIVLSKVSPQITWPTNDIYVGGSGTSHSLNVDQNQEGQKNVFLAAKTVTGKVITMEYEFHICSENCIQASSSLQTISGVFGQFSNNTSSTNLQKIDGSAIPGMAKVVNCTWCKNIAYRLVIQSDLSVYSGGQVWMDANNNIWINTIQRFKTPLYVEVYFTDSDCSFVNGLKIPVELEVCGFETVLVQDSFEFVQFNFTWRYNSNTKDNAISNQTYRFSVAQPSQCKIVSYALQDNERQSLSESGQTVWSQFISVNSTNGQINVNHNNAPNDIANNTVFEIYLTAITNGNVKGVMKLLIKLKFPFVNQAPHFVKQLEEQYLFSIDGNEWRQGYDYPVQSIELPQIYDSEGDNVTFTYFVNQTSPCNCFSLKTQEGRGQDAKVWLEVNRSRVSKEDEGFYAFRLDLTDDMYGVSYQKIISTFIVRIVYNDPDLIPSSQVVVVEDDPYEVFADPPEFYDHQTDVDFVAPAQDTERVILDRQTRDDMWKSHINRLEKFSFEKVENPPPVEIRIKLITKNGLIYIRFNQLLIVPDFQEFWLRAFLTRNNSLEASENSNQSQSSNNSVPQNLTASGSSRRRLFETRNSSVDYSWLNVTRDLLQFKYRLKSDINKTRIKYDLELFDWTSDGLVFNITFDDPYAVSMGYFLDQAYVQVIHPWLFVSQRTGVWIEEDYQTLVDGFPRQIKFDDKHKLLFEQSSKLGRALVMIMIICPLLLSLYGLPITDIWVLVYWLQFISHIDVFVGFFLPQSSQILVDKLKEVAHFEVLDPISLFKLIKPDFRLAWHLQGGLGEAWDIFFEVLDDLHLPLIFLMLTAIIFLLEFVVVWVLRNSNQTQKAKLLSKKTFHLKTALKYNWFQRVFVLSYMEICIILFRQSKELLIFHKEANIEAQVLLCLLLLIAFSAPLLVIFILKNSYNVLDQTKSWDKVLVLVEEVHIYKSRSNVYFIGFFMFKRFLNCAIALSLYLNRLLALIAIIFLNLFFTMWYLHKRYHIKTNRILLEAFNEGMAIILFYHFLTFSDWVPAAETRELMGFSFNMIIVFVFGTNVFVLLVIMFEKIMHKQAMMKRKREFRRLFTRQEQVAQINFNAILQYQENLQIQNAPDSDLLLANNKFPLQQQTVIPKLYKKKVYLRASNLEEIKEEDRDDFEKDLNDNLFKELGNFGDIVEMSRIQLTQGYEGDVKITPEQLAKRPKQKKRQTEIQPPKLWKLPSVPDAAPQIQGDFNEESRKRWEGYGNTQYGTEGNLMHEIAGDVMSHAKTRFESVVGLFETSFKARDVISRNGRAESSNNLEIPSPVSPFMSKSPFRKDKKKLMRSKTTVAPGITVEPLTNERPPSRPKAKNDLEVLSVDELHQRLVAFMKEFGEINDNTVDTMTEDQERVLDALYKQIKIKKDKEAKEE